MRAILLAGALEGCLHPPPPNEPVATEQVATEQVATEQVPSGTPEANPSPPPADDPMRCVDATTQPVQPSGEADEPERAAELQPLGLEPNAPVRFAAPRDPADWQARYPAGLGRNPKLAGRVTFRFVIGTDGTVGTLVVPSNELTDCEVTECIRAAFSKVTFPAPEGGIVTVQYPIMFEPDE